VKNICGIIKHVAEAYKFKSNVEFLRINLKS